MKKSAFEVMGLVALVLGGVSTYVAMIAYYYGGVSVGMYGAGMQYPMRPYFPVPLIIGIALLVLGYGFMWKANREAVSS